ncbi:MAG TPA: cupin domain-containing protein [Novosphingobium sp.]|nr:cupin domain-containing protein [Novosphingobium sp.]
MSDCKDTACKAVIASRKPFYRQLRAGQKISWCSCGRSRRQPFCDSVSHEGTGFEPIVYVAQKDEEVLLCGCKQTCNGPHCDGAHNNLPGGYSEEPEHPDADIVQLIAPDEAGFARLDGECFVVSPPQPAGPDYEIHKLVTPSLGAQHQSQFYIALARGASPVLASDMGDIALWVSAGTGSITIEGRSFALAAPCGVNIRQGEGFRIEAGDEPLAIYASQCPGGEELTERDAMTGAFDAIFPERIAAIDEEARHAMGPRYFQVLLDERHGLRDTAQFIGHIPLSRAEMHRHLYEEALIILSGGGVIWNETRRARVKAGDVIFFPRKIRHSLQCDQDCGMDVVGLIHPGTNPGINYA